LPKLKPKRLYLVPAVSKVFDILELLQREKRPLSLEDIHQKVKAPKTTVYRLLKTCVHRGYVAQGQDGLYRIANQPRKLRFGFAGQSSAMPFSQTVTKSLRSAAVHFGVDLVVLDNRYDADTAVRNADKLIQEQVDLIIEFQVEQSVAAVIADKISGAGIPLIAVDMPHPHATYFGADNYRMGYRLGEALGGHAIKYWRSKVRWVLGLDLEQAGPFVQNRTIGAFDGIRAQLPELLPDCFVRMDSRGLRDRSYRVVLDFLRRHMSDRGILIACHNDVVALGALEAVRELHCEKFVAIGGQDCTEEALKEMAAPRSPFIASISHEAETYGEKLIPLGLALLRQQAVAPYNFTPHRVVSQESLRKGHAATDEKVEGASGSSGGAGPRAKVQEDSAAGISTPRN
jgi:ribose transport system substrate-binding protein